MESVKGSGDGEQDALRSAAHDKNPFLSAGQNMPAKSSSGQKNPPSGIPFEEMGDKVLDSFFVSREQMVKALAEKSKLETELNETKKQLAEALVTLEAEQEERRGVKDVNRKVHSHAQKHLLRLERHGKSLESLGERDASVQGPAVREAKTRSLWSAKEHEAFLEGLKRFGRRDVRSIAELVGTRTVTQVRSHAQKHSLKLERQREIDSNEDEDSEDLGGGDTEGEEAGAVSPVFGQELEDLAWASGPLPAASVGFQPESGRMQRSADNLNRWRDVQPCPRPEVPARAGSSAGFLHDTLHSGMQSTPPGPAGYLALLPPPALLVPPTQMWHGRQESELSSSSPSRFGAPRPGAICHDSLTGYPLPGPQHSQAAPAPSPFDRPREAALPPATAAQDQRMQPILPSPQEQHAINCTLLEMLQRHLTKLGPAAVQGQVQQAPASAAPPLAVPTLFAPTSQSYAKAAGALSAGHNGSIWSATSALVFQQGSSTARPTSLNTPHHGSVQVEVCGAASSSQVSEQAATPAIAPGPAHPLPHGTIEVCPRKKRGHVDPVDQPDSLLLDKNTLAALYHLPLKEAAEALGICPTTVKNACRKLGLPKWPYRKLQKQRRRALLMARARSDRAAGSPAPQ